MAIDAEPKDGDFARYIENLTRAGGTTPGRVPPKREASQRLPEPAPKPAATTGSLSPDAWGRSTPQPSSRSTETAAPPSFPDHEEVAAASLARMARQRKIGAILTIGGVLTGWAAARIAFQVFRGPGFSMDELMPAIFLAFFAVMLFKAAGNARNPRKTPLAKLPPLKPSSYRKDSSA